MSEVRPVKPPRLSPGDAVAVVSPSWGGPAAFPHVFEKGQAALRGLGLEIRELPTTRKTPEWLQAHPQARADDVNAAFADPAIRAVFASIGGDDSIRLLPFLDASTIAANPKILMGYSDTTTLLAAVRRMGLVTFHGPAVMAGLAQADALPPAFLDHVRTMLFEPAGEHRYDDYGGFVEGYPDWRDPANAGLVNAWQPDAGPRVLQGSGTIAGELFGGCLEVLDWLRGTSAWPAPEELDGRLLMVEPSEEKPTALQAQRILRSMGVLGAFDRVAGILVGRERDFSAQERAEFDAALVESVAQEFGRPDLPILANLPFGHTDPQWILPVGVRAELDVEARTLRLVEPWLT